jgi:hypothetical protein
MPIDWQTGSSFDSIRYIAVDFPFPERLSFAGDITNTEASMKYLCLVYVEETILQAMSRSERMAISDESMAYCDELTKNGQLVAASPLQPVQMATTVRVRDGKAAVTDGPFAETKEQLGGYFLIDVKDLNDAIRVASRIPPARLGSIEVRPVKDGGCAD